MSNKSTQTTTELRHYIRANKRASEQEIVIEEVKAGSASFDFLKKMEARRKRHECVRTIDMRGKVPYECKSYVHKNQVFWMDDISYAIFLRGLKKNNNVFTNEVFEEIVNGDHTNHKNNSTNKNTLNSKPSTSATDSAQTSALNEEKFRIEGNDADIFYLGYYQKRTENRIKHSIDISIRHANTTILAKTKDVSASGFKAAFQRPVQLDQDDVIEVSYDGFASMGIQGLGKVVYTVVSLEYIEPDFIVRARITDPEDRAATIIADFIEEQRQHLKGRRKLDIEDIRLTSESLLTELFYTNTTPTIPFFIRTTEQGPRLQTLCVNQVNKSIIQCFRNSNDYFDFTNLSDQQRLQKLIEHVQEDGQKDPLMAVYADDSGNPRVMFDFEFESFDQWQTFILDKLNRKNLKLFKILIRKVARPDKRKLDQKIDKLREKAAASVPAVLDYSNHITKAGVLVEVTAEINASLASIKLDIELLKKANLLASRLAELKGTDVEIIQFGYTEQRREDRYHVSVDAVIHLDNKKCRAVTRDISLKGLCVELQTMDHSGFKKGDEVKIDFPVLHQRAKERIKLVDMPYTITCIHIDEGKPILHFKREKTRHWNEQTGFFKDMIDRNIDLIKLDTKDIETATKSKLVGSIAVENTATLPLFILKNTDGGGRTASIALPPQPGDLTDFFEVEPGIYDFKPITHPNRLSRLTQNSRNAQVAELIIYMYKKQVPGIAKFTIYSAIDNDFDNDTERREFMQTCLEHDYCIIKISASQVQRPADTEIVNTVENLQDSAPHVVQRLHNQFNNVIAIGDIVDISGVAALSL